MYETFLSLEKIEFSSFLIDLNKERESFKYSRTNLDFSVKPSGVR